MKSESMAQKVTDLINAKTFSEQKKRDKIYLEPEEFRKFMDEMEPVYKEKYGGFISLDSCDEFNILFNGHPIVCKMEKKK